MLCWDFYLLQTCKYSFLSCAIKLTCTHSQDARWHWLDAQLYAYTKSLDSIIEFLDGWERNFHCTIQLLT